MIGLHPERVAGDPQAVRWVMPPGTLPVGLVRTAPGRLGELLADGTLGAGLVEHGALWLWLRAGESWSQHGAAVRSALRDALADPGGWTVEEDPGTVLDRVVGDLLDGSVGDFIRSHGGSARAERVGDGAVVVHLGGACANCAAAEFTLRARLLDQLRRRCPDVAEVDRSGGRLTVRLGGSAGGEELGAGRRGV